MELFKSKLIYPKLVKTICVNATLWFCLIAVWKSGSWAHGREKGKKVGEREPLNVRPGEEWRGEEEIRAGVAMLGKAG